VVLAWHLLEILVRNLIASIMPERVVRTNRNFLLVDYLELVVEVLVEEILAITEEVSLVKRQMANQSLWIEELARTLFLYQNPETHHLISVTVKDHLLVIQEDHHQVIQTDH